MSISKLMSYFGVIIAVSSASLPAFAEKESSGKVASYRCDDGERDGGYEFRVTDFNDQVQDVIVFEKTKASVTELLRLKLRRVELVDGSQFLFYGVQDGLSITMIRAPRIQGPLSAASFAFTDREGAHGFVTTVCEKNL